MAGYAGKGWSLRLRGFVNEAGCGKDTTRRSRNHKGRGVGKPEDWSGVLARSAKSMRAERPALLLENRRPPVPSVE